MSQDRPTASDILGTVREFLAELRPKLEGEAQYHALVSVHLLGIVERELSLAAASDRQEHAELAEFLHAAGSLDELTRKLCGEIRGGACDNNWDQLFELVMKQIVNKLRIVRPEYLDPIHSGPPAGAVKK